VRFLFSCTSREPTRTLNPNRSLRMTNPSWLCQTGTKTSAACTGRNVSYDNEGNNDATWLHFFPRVLSHLVHEAELYCLCMRWVIYG
jgi:hypothetical protein